MAGLIVYTFLIGLTFYVARTWMRWSGSAVKWGDPQWRGIIATFGFATSSLSLSIILFLAIYAILTGGFPYYSPPLMLAFRVGFSTALAGVLAAFVGKGPLEIPTIISSILCLLIWFVEAIAQ